MGVIRTLFIEYSFNWGYFWKGKVVLILNKLNIYCSQCNDYIGFNVTTKGRYKNPEHKDFILT